MITMKRLKIVALTMLLGMFASVVRVNAQDVAEGEQIFKNNCAACHNTSAEPLVGRPSRCRSEKTVGLDCKVGSQPSGSYRQW
jgi:mono/diheme cytochrome c family protein